MQNNIFYKVNVSTRILILIILSLSLFISRSLYFLIFLSILILIIFILTNKSVKFYIDFIKKIKFLLLFSFIIYIIVIGGVLNSFIFVYKIMLLTFLVEHFKLTVTFQTLTNGIKTLLKKIIKIKYLNEISYNISTFIYFFNTYLDTKEIVKCKYNKNSIYFGFSLKHNILPRLFMTIQKMKNLESSLKLKFYEPKFEEKSIKSNIVLILFFALFVVVIFKEVIL